MVCPSFGNYPREYNRAVHGPYYPWVNYGKTDTPLQEVKLGEFKTWFARRSKTPQAAVAAISRALNLYQYRWMHTRFGSGMPALVHISAVTSFGSFLMLLGYLKSERQHKYHW